MPLTTKQRSSCQGAARAMEVSSEPDPPIETTTGPSLILLLNGLLLIPQQNPSSAQVHCPTVER